MYIPEFWVGVAATLLSEIGLIVVAAIASYIHSNKRNRR